MSILGGAFDDREPVQHVLERNDRKWACHDYAEDPRYLGTLATLGSKVLTLGTLASLVLSLETAENTLCSTSFDPVQ